MLPTKKTRTISKVIWISICSNTLKSVTKDSKLQKLVQNLFILTLATKSYMITFFNKIVKTLFHDFLKF